jgi:hypothetical protein
MSSESGPALVSRLQAKFAHFARHAVQDDPLYAALTDAASRRADWAALLAAAPASQQSPTLWLAALQDRVLELVDGGARPALADYYASAGVARAPDAAFLAHLGGFLADNHAELAARIRTRTNQTNEIGRCAVLWPVLQSLADKTGQHRFALLDVGCSAGLNLGVDCWRYRYLDDATGATIASALPDRDAHAPEIACRVLAGARPGSEAAPKIVARAGIDLSPVDVHDDAAIRWLRACLWPHDGERRARFDAAVAIARTQRWPVGAIADAAAAIGQWLDAVPERATPVVFNSWVLAYFDAEPLRRHVEQLRTCIAARGAVWISAEDPGLSRTWWPAMPEVDAMKLPNATAWTVGRPDGQGGVAWELPAVSHAHGRWMQWNG